MRILREQGEPAVLIEGLTNIYSDETDVAKIQKDFNELLKDWHGAEWLEESRKENFILKSRDVYVRDGKISAREIGIIESLKAAEITPTSDNSKIEMPWDGSDGDVVETNGKITKHDGKTFIEWPKDATELRVKARQTLKANFAASQPLMLNLLKQHIAKLAGEGK
jgi:hypothetical protein